MPNYIEHKLYNDAVTIKFDEANHAYWLLDNGKMKRLCGVTTFLGIIDKPALIPWAVRTTVEYIRQNLDKLAADPAELLKLAKEEANKQRDIAAEIGSAIHRWIEQHIKGENPEMPDDDKVLMGVNSFLEWVSRHQVKFLASEKVVYSQRHNYVGTLDIIAEINGKKTLLDIKTGNGIYAEVKMQTAAYLMAHAEETADCVTDRCVLRISKETEEQYRERMMKFKKYQDAPDTIPPFQLFEAVDLDRETLNKDFGAFLNCVNLYRWKAESKF